MITEHYQDSMQHLLAELERLDLYIQAQVQHARELQAADDEFQGLYISEEEVDALLAKSVGAARWASAKSGSLGNRFEAAAAHMREKINRRKEQSLRLGIPLRLETLAQLFDLTPFDADAILVCLAPELDLRYERLYAYLHDDVTKKRPSVDLVLNLLCSSFEDRLSARQRFGPNAPLIRHDLVSLFDDPGQQKPTRLAKFLKLDDRISDYLLGSDEIDGRISAVSERIIPRARLDGLRLPKKTKERLSHLANAEDAKDGALIFYLQGPYGVGKQAVTEAFCCERGRELLVVDGQRLLAQPGEEYERTLRLVAREALLQEATFYWKGFDAYFAGDQRPRLAMLSKMLEEREGVTFLAGNEIWEPSGALHDVPFLRVEIPRPEYQERVGYWAEALEGVAQTKDVNPEALAGGFRFSGGQIRDAARTARNLARWRDPDRAEITAADLNNACRLQSNRKLSQLAQKITPRYSWDDIVLPAKRLQRLREVYNAVRCSPTVYSEWGFGQKLSLGKGLGVLFAGPSGTGKTMAAEIVAGELGLDMYKIDLSTVVSKYIGETEKNLSRIFTEAETANAILFFDEADTLFGKRSEVRDSHDRYANIEIGYLLQRMEEYEGVVILATNFDKNMDEAFVRRLHFNLEFPFPQEKDRRRIWQGIWPKETPLSSDLDLDFMAKRFELAGGNIKNIALTSAFLAADGIGVVDMSHLIIATRREYDKMGRIIMAGEFGEYGRLVAAM